MLLALASGNTFLDGTDSGTISTISPDLAAVAKQAFYDFGEKPIWSERMVYGKSMSMVYRLIYGVSDVSKANIRALRYSAVEEKVWRCTCRGL